MANINGTGGNNVLNGTSASDRFQGYAGDDELRDYSGGNDTYVFSPGDGHDLIADYNSAAAAEQDVLLLGSGFTAGETWFEAVGSGGLRIAFRNHASDSVTIQYHLYGDGRWDFQWLEFSDGSRLDISYASTAYPLTFNGSAASDTSYSSFGGPDLMFGNDGNDSLSGGSGNDTVRGDNGHDVLWGDEGADTLYGGAGTDTLYGGAGNDLLDGGTGSDEMWGGDGDDTYRVDRLSDQVIDSVGSNTVRIGAALDNYKAPAGFTVIYDSADTLRLPYFIDALTSGDSWGAIGSGATVDFSFVETSTLEGFQPYQAGQKTLVRNILAEYSAVSGLVFNEVTDSEAVRIRFFKDGGPAAIGAAGYAYYPQHGDVHIDPDYAGNYHVLFHEIGHALGLKHPGDYGGSPDGPFLPVAEDTTDNTQMSYHGYGEGGNYFRLFDLAAIQYLYGINPTARTGNDTYSYTDRYIWDGGGTDTLSLAGAAAGVTVDLRDGAWCWVGAKADSILSAGQFYIGCGSQLENVVGSVWNDTLRGNELSNRLQGGKGNDTYVAGTGDTITELAGEGVDWVQSGVSWTLRDHLENLQLTGSAAANGSGNTLDNQLTGNAAANALYGGSGNDMLDGGAGPDTLVGGTGDDVLVLDSGADVIVEYYTGGSDTVRAGFGDYTLGNYLENLVLTGTASIRGGGNNLSNRVEGNAGDNAITGLKGNDTLIGGAGNDTLDGGSGTDSMAGGLGNDEYVVDGGSDLVQEEADAGTDTVVSSTNWTLGANLENLILSGTVGLNGGGNGLDNTLTGNAGANILSSSAGHDVLDGGVGADTLIGGTGDDTYCLNEAGDVVTEYYTGGIDTVREGYGHYTLGNHLENLVLTGTLDINGIGNSLGNTLQGNAGLNRLEGLNGNDRLLGYAGQDWLDGGAGADTMTGGTGDDTYRVDSLADVIEEYYTGGVDSVEASISYTLGNHLENLALAGTADNAATGNALGNRLTGNTGANILTGGRGNDTYTAYRGMGTDQLVENDTTSGNQDKVLFEVGIAHDQLWFSQNGADLEAWVIGTMDRVVVKNWYGDASARIEEFLTTDGARVLAAVRVESLVSAMAAIAPPSAGQTSLDPVRRAQLDAVIAANWS